MTIKSKKPQSQPSQRVSASTTRKHTVRIPKVAEVVASKLRRQIISGELKEGDKLPSETELISHFGVARSTFREAFRILEAEGLISVSRGARTGATIHRPSIRIASKYVNLVMQANKVTFDDVYQSLGLFEPAVIRLLAEKATKADVKSLRKEIAAAYASLDDDYEYGVRAANFHRLLVERAGLKSLTILMDLVSDLIRVYVEASAAVRVRVEGREAKMAVMRIKEKLVDMIEKHDSAAAEAHWKKYFETTRDVMRKLLPSKSVQEAYEFD
jgi:DNA-binding FadR family transcriptional regulator